ncbi:MAG: alpha/beta hydrolase [Burkholderiales bacterium]
MPSLRNGDVDLWYDVRGTGAPLLLVAGLAADSAFWLPVMDALAAQRRVIVVDNRGSGRTTPPDAATGIAAMADDCAALVRHLRLPKVDVAGHSMGGMIAQDFAIRHPELADRVVLASTAPFVSARNNDLFASWAAFFESLDRASWFRNLYYWVLSSRFFDNRVSVEALVKMAAVYPYQQTPQALRNQVAAIAKFDSRGALSSLRARTLVLAGTEDLLFTTAESAAFAKSIPHATFVAVEGAAHSFPAEAPQDFTRNVLGFLASR